MSGGALADLQVPARPGTHRQPCPSCNRGPRDTALAIKVEGNGAWVYFCHRCGLRGAGGCGEAAPPKPLPAVNDNAEARLKMRWIWRNSVAIGNGSPAARYLASRNCALPPEGSDLRWSRKLRHPCGWLGSALVARVTAAETAQPMTLHLTWLQADGSGKAPIERPRMLLRGLPKRLGVVRLWPDETVRTGLAVAEGIETALSAAHGFTPVWATIDAGNMAILPVLAGIEALTVVADYDRAGLDAAKALAHRWSDAGTEVRLWRPDEPGTDCNDHVRLVAAGECH